MDLKQAVKEFFRAEQALSDHIRACDTSTCLQREALHTAYSDALDELKAALEATPDALVNAEQNYKILLENTDSEIAENNAGFDAGEKGLDRDLARAAYLDGKPDYDVFDTGYVMGVLKGDAGNLDKLFQAKAAAEYLLGERNKEIERLRTENRILKQEYNQAETYGDEQRAEMQKYRAENARLRAALEGDE